MPRAGFALHQAPVAALEASLPAGEQHLLCRAVANDGAIQPARGARNEWFGIRIEAAASATQAKG